ncbi:hypothetical protein Lal_00036503 [Lupinus albus]|nr:hypothetical protein Lal_00036503 [Lupinus albus]
MDGHDSEDPKQSTADMTAFVQNLLLQMLEQSINDLRAEIGVEGPPSPAAPAKPIDEEESNKEEGSA